MLKRLRPHLSYANVMATIAVFVALGGSSYAALQITGRDIKDGTLTGKDLKRNSIGARQIAETRLGPVRRATNAERLAGRPAARYLDSCPDGTVPVSNTCIETQARAAAPYSTAETDCEVTGRPAGPGRRLPTHAELMTAIGDSGIELAPGGELTSNVYPPASADRRLEVLVVVDATGNVALTPDIAAGAKPFRCVTDPHN